MLLLSLSCAMGVEPRSFEQPAGHLLAVMDTDRSGDLSVDEVMAIDAAGALARVDRNQDGRISPEELSEELARASREMASVAGTAESVPTKPPLEGEPRRRAKSGQHDGYRGLPPLPGQDGPEPSSSSHGGGAR